MKNLPKFLAIVILVIVGAGLLIRFTLFRDQTPYGKIESALARGEEAQHEAYIESQACERLENYLRVYCQLTYSYQHFLFLNGTPAERVAMSSEMLTDEFPIHFISLGMALSKLVNGPKENEAFILSNIKKQNQQALVVDGWGYAQILIKGKSIEEALGECEGFSNEDFKKACRFGVGRSLFYKNKGKNIDERQLEGIRPAQLSWLYRGYGFARAYGGLENPDSQKNAEMQIGMLIGKVLRISLPYMDKKFATTAETDIVNCIKKEFFYAFCQPGDKH